MPTYPQLRVEHDPPEHVHPAVPLCTLIGACTKFCSKKFSMLAAQSRQYEHICFYLVQESDRCSSLNGQILSTQVSKLNEPCPDNCCPRRLFDLRCWHLATPHISNHLQFLTPLDLALYPTKSPEVNDSSAAVCANLSAYLPQMRQYLSIYSISTQ